MREPPKTCPHCGAKMVEYKHRLNAGLVSAIRQLYQKSGIEWLHLDRLRLTYAQRCNFQKLQYWGLVAKTQDRQGLWRITPKGERYVTGELAIPSIARTYRGKFTRFDGQEVLVPDPVPRRYDRAPDSAQGALAFGVS